MKFDLNEHASRDLGNRTLDRSPKGLLAAGRNEVNKRARSSVVTDEDRQKCPGQLGTAPSLTWLNSADVPWSWPMLTGRGMGSSPALPSLSTTVSMTRLRGQAKPALMDGSIAEDRLHALLSAC